MMYQTDSKARLRWKIPFKLVPVVPTKRMLRAAQKAMAPDNPNRPAEWVSNSVKHTLRFQAMIAVAPEFK